MTTPTTKPTVSAAIRSIFASQRQKFGAARPDQGSGLGIWPPKGVSVNYLLGITVRDDDSFRYTDKMGKEHEVPAINIRFHYRTVEPLDGQTDPLDWGGAPFTMVSSWEGMTDNYVKMFEITRNRLAGHLTAILGVTVGTADGLPEDEALAQAIGLCSGDVLQMLQITIQERLAKSKKEGATAADSTVRKTEFIDKNLTLDKAPAAPAA